MNDMEKQLMYMAHDDILNEYINARDRFPAFNSGHEGYAVILEELDELWEEVTDNKRDPKIRRPMMRKEAMQVAAMALAFMVECCNAQSREN